MTKVAFVTSTSSSHRGIGFYASRLLQHMRPLAPQMGIELLELDASLGCGHCDLVHYAWFDLFYHTLPTFLPKPSIISVLDAIPLEFPTVYHKGLKGRLNLALQKFSLAQAKKVITLSHASVNSIHRYLGVPHQKLNLIYLAADAQFKPLPHPYFVSLPRQFVLYVGGINYNKNLPTLIQACKQLNLHLVIVGREAANVESLDLSHPELEHLQALDWSGVTRLGFVSDADLVTIYNLATVYCQPSFAEGFGLPVLEAMACGTPVVVSQTHSLPELVGETGIYFDPTSVSDLATKLTSAISHPPAAAQLVAQAAKFSWVQAAQATLNVYLQVCHPAMP